MRVMEPSLRRLDVGSVTLEAWVEGEGPLCILVHGWPETLWSWRHQVQPLVEAGYQVVVPNVRGYGGSDAPDDVSAYQMSSMVGDVLGIMDAFGRPTATLIGHDWGAPIVWHTALFHPERVDAVAGLSVPHLGRNAPVPPTELFAAMYPERFFYILYFQQEGVPEAEFERDVRDALAKIYFASSGDSTPELRKSLRTRTRAHGYLDRLVAPDPFPPWLTDGDLDRYAAAFERSGFRGGLNRYRCMDVDWHAMEPWAEAKIQPPALFLAGEHDSVLRYAPGVNLMDIMDVFYADLRAKVGIPGAGHWVQQEQPGRVNDAILEFLANR